MIAPLLETYTEQVQSWPLEGRHILAAYDEENIVVYQAYRPEIGLFAAAHQRFGGEFSFSRMSWIKPNFLWMMYRSGWGTKEGQEVTLAVTIPRTLFDEILAQAVPSSFDFRRYKSIDDWKAALAASEVRLQWDPDHAPDGKPQARRAIQLGLRGKMLRRYAAEEVVKIADLSSLVAEQREHLRNDASKLRTPRERIYLPRREDAIGTIGIDDPPAAIHP
jgi:Domain of unknown function (DUF4291)